MPLGAVLVFVVGSAVSCPYFAVLIYVLKKTRSSITRIVYLPRLAPTPFALALALSPSPSLSLPLPPFLPLSLISFTPSLFLSPWHGWHAGRKGVALTRTLSYLQTWFLTYLATVQRWDMLGALIYRKRGSSFYY